MAHLKLRSRQVPLNLHVHEISVNETRQIKATTPEDNSFFSREKKELPQVGFEPATSCVLGRRSTSWATEAAQLGRPNLSRLCNAKGVTLTQINRVTVTQYCAPVHSVLCTCTCTCTCISLDLSIHVYVYMYQGFYMLQSFALFPSTFELLFIPMGNLETFVYYLIVWST